MDMPDMVVREGKRVKGDDAVVLCESRFRCFVVEAT
jgi:hypothetical protein